jgi:hypothetical protein
MVDPPIKTFTDLSRSANSGRSTLPLLVARIRGALNPNHALPADHFAVLANLLH